MINSRLKILGITLARGGSKSIPKKNIRPISGRPLIAYTIREALKSRYISRYIVSTDDKHIQDIAIQYGADTPFLRPAEFATDDASSLVALKHAVSFVEDQEKCRYDYVVELMCTNPLKRACDIDLCIEKLIRTGADSVIAVHKLEDHHPIRIKKIVDDRLVDFCLEEVPEARRQDLKPEAFIRSGSIYSVRRDELMIHDRRYGSENSRPYILPPHRAINIDTEIDFLVAERLLESCRSLNRQSYD